MMRKRLLCAIMLMACVMASMAQTMKSHTVQRGETLESIARKHGVTVEAIKQANPTMGEFFYVGMGVNIPGKADVADAPVASVQSMATDSSAISVQPMDVPVSTPVPPEPVKENGDEVVTRKGTWSVTGRAGYHALDYEEGMDLNGFGTATMLGADYFFSEQAYMKICAGYAYASKYKGNVTKEGQTSMEMHSIRIPVSVNYLVPMGGHRGFSFGAGPYLDYVVYGKSEFKQNKTEVKTKFSDMEGTHDIVFGIHLQATLMFSEMFGIFGEYGFGLTERFKENKENYWSVGIAYGF